MLWGTFGGKGILAAQGFWGALANCLLGAMYMMGRLTLGHKTWF
jgi:hypothetical protein